MLAATISKTRFNLTWISFMCSAMLTSCNDSYMFGLSGTRHHTSQPYAKLTPKIFARFLAVTDYTPKIAVPDLLQPNYVFTTRH